ncbi:unnamed protein product, partial [Discosporangium mesarthrocarpum]
MSGSWVAVVTLLIILAAPINEAATIKVSPSGSPSLSDAVKSAKPGDTIHLADGRYKTGIMSATDGTEDAPITITGSRSAVVSGVNPDDRTITIKHSHIHLRGFTVDGKMGSGDTLNSYANKCIYVHGQNTPKDITYMGHTFPSSINGLVLSNMSIKNCQGECIRMRYFITHADIQDNDIQNCGVDDFVFNANTGGKNGEGLYIGTSSNQWSDGKNPDDRPDGSNFNLVKNNIFLTHGNECVETKEGTEHNVIEGNTCGGQLDPESACYGTRGDHNVFRNNKGEGCEGAGIRLGGHFDYGINNKVYNNEVSKVMAGSIKVMKSPQEEICGNVCGSGDCSLMGDFGDQFSSEWDKACPGSIGSDLQPYGVSGGGNFIPPDDDGGMPIEDDTVGGGDSSSSSSSGTDFGDEEGQPGDDDRNEEEGGGNGNGDQDREDKEDRGNDDNSEEEEERNGGNDDNSEEEEERNGGNDDNSEDEEERNGGNDDNSEEEEERNGGNDDNSEEEEERNGGNDDNSEEEEERNGGNDDNSEEEEERNGG